MAEPPVVAIAGATGGLGPVVARRLADAGAILSLAGRDQDKLDDLAASLGPLAEGQEVDLLDAAATMAWADAVDGQFGRVDAVLHLVGGWRGGKPIEEAPLDDWDHLHGLLVRTVQHVSRAFAPHLLASRGRFAIVSSSQAQAPTSGNAAYAAAKAAAEAWTLALADRFRGTGATANVVVVGSILTPALRAEKPGEAFAGHTPAEEIADALAFIAEGRAPSMNGQRVVLRGA